MAQKIDALKFRLGRNALWLSQWYSKKNYANIVFEDCLIRKYLMRIFDLRGFLSKRCLIKRRKNNIYIFLEFYSNSFVDYQVPRYHRNKKKIFHKILKLKHILTFLKHLSKNKVFISFKNLFLINRMHRAYLKRLKGLFSKYKNMKFSQNILNIFNIGIRTRSSFFLTKIVSKEFVYVNKKKKR